MLFFCRYKQFDIVIYCNSFPTQCQRLGKPVQKQERERERAIYKMKNNKQKIQKQRMYKIENKYTKQENNEKNIKHNC